MELDNVQETMILPLYGRAIFSQNFPQILEDSLAQDIIKKVNYDFTRILDSFGEYEGIAYLARARVFDHYVKEYIEKSPSASIINLGSGLDTTFSRVDNGTIYWYNIDLPEAIKFRESLIQVKDREKNLPFSMFNYSWMDEISYSPEKGVFILAGGVFTYFYEDQIKTLVHDLSVRFPLGKILFDIPSKIGMKVANRHVKKSGIENAQMKFGLGNTQKTILSWSDNIELVDSFPLFAGVPRLKEWVFSTKIKMYFCDKWNMGKYVLIKFKNKPR